MNRPQSKAIVALVTILSLSCGLFPGSVNPPPPTVQAAPPSQTPTLQVIATSTPQLTPTSVIPAGTPSGDGYAVVVQTDTTGTAVVTDPVNGQQKNIRVRAAESGNQLPDIQLTYVSNGTDFIILAVDPSRQYLPMAYASEATGHNVGSVKLAALNRQGLTEIIIILTLLSAIQTVEDFINLFQHPPRLEKWGWLYDETCWTPEQMAQVSSVGILAATTFLGVPGFAEIGRFFKVADQALLDMLRIAQFGAEYDIQQRLLQFNGILRFRLYHAPVPIFQPVGFCLNPIDTTDANSFMEWATYIVKYKESSLVDRLVGPTGARFAPYGVGFEPPGYDNGTTIAEEIRIALAKSDPICIGYEYYSSERTLIYFQGIKFDWTRLGVGEEDVVYFGFWQTDQGIELLLIVPVPDWGMPRAGNLIPCPDV